MSTALQDVILLWMMGFMSVAAENKQLCEFKFQEVLLIEFLESKTLKLQQYISTIVVPKILQVFELMIFPLQSATLEQFYISWVWKLWYNVQLYHHWKHTGTL